MIAKGRGRWWLAITAIVLVQGACVPATTRFVVDVSSLADPDAAQTRSYVLLPLNDDVDATDLQFREYASYVRRALTARGLAEAESMDAADTAIFLAYGIGDPEHIPYSYSMPVYGKVRGGTTTISGSSVSSSGVTSVNGTVTEAPEYGVVGSRTVSGVHTVFFRYMVVDAVDLTEYRATGQAISTWRTTVTSSGSSGDLRLVFPYLVAASLPHLGANTGESIRVTLPENDKSVMALRAPSAQLNP